MTSVVPVGNEAYNRLHEHFSGQPVSGDTRDIVIDACKVVGGPIFFSIVIMLLSFAPIFVLGGIEGKMFNPLACTKTFALAGVAVLAITLVPAMIPTFVRGKLRSQEDAWLVRSFVNIYKPMLEFFLDHPDLIVVLTGIFLLAGIPIFPRKVPWIFFVVGAPFIVCFSTMLVAKRKLPCLALLFVVALASFKAFRPLGEEFMPPLDELSILDMPITTPNVNITQASNDIKERDSILRGFPEVHQVVGKLGRAETPTDPAPIDMVETIVSLRPKEWWPKRKVHYEDALKAASQVSRALVSQGILGPMTDGDLFDVANKMAITALAQFDREMRQLSTRRLREQSPERARELIRLLRDDVLGFLKAKGALKATGQDEAGWVALEGGLVQKYAPAFDEWVLLEDVAQAAREILSYLESKGAVNAAPDLWAEPETLPSRLLGPVLALVGGERTPVFERWRRALDSKLGELMADRVQRLSWEIQDRAPGTLVWHLIDDAVANGRETGHLAREPSGDELKALRAAEEKSFGKGFFLWRKLKSDLGKEMDSELQFPGWGNIWTQPIINRVDMLATGVRTMIGVKVFGTRLEDSEGGKGIQTISNEIAAVLKKIPGAADVSPDQIVGENYLEIAIDREKAARYGVNADDVQSVIEVALGGKEITMTVEGRQRFPVRVRYPRDWLEDEEMVKGILVPASSSGGMGGMRSGILAAPAAEGVKADAAPQLQQVPLSLLTDIKVVPGPSMIKSENGLLRSYVQLNVRDRDIVGFVEEARRAVEAQVKLPPGYYLEWSGQFEHQMRAQKTLTMIFPLVIFIIFVILYMTYKDFADTLMMFLAVPGAIAGGALFQYIFGYNFSVAVWVGYVACFGLAAETGIVMLVYLREAIDKRGGMARIRSFEEIKEAVIEGAVHRLRPKLLTEATMILALVPMLWATGVGAEFMRPMAAPILGGILVADEVIDILIPVLFYQERCRRLRKAAQVEDRTVVHENS